MTDVQQNDELATASATGLIITAVSFRGDTLNLKIGRTGEKAKFQGREVSLDLSKLPLTSLAFALTYGLKQYIADGTAGSEDQAGYDLGIDQRLRKLAEGDFTRTSGERTAKPDTPERRALKMATDALKAKIKASGATADAAKIKEAAAKMVEAQPRWLADAKKAIAAEARLAEELDIDDFLGDMIGLTDGDEGEADV